MSPASHPASHPAVWTSSEIAGNEQNLNKKPYISGVRPKLEDGLNFWKWKTTKILGKWKTTSIFWKMEDDFNL
jgi:hypothetical protein